MEIREIANKNEWENFLSGCKEKTFLQSWNWGEFQEKIGNKIWRSGIYDEEKLVFIALVVKIAAKRGTFLLIQHLLETDESVLEFLLNKLKEIGKEEGAIFIRLAPLWLRNEGNGKIFKDLGFRKAPMHANAYTASWKLDIAISEDELMKNMRKTTRYLIRQAMKNPDIVIEKSDKLDDIKIYQELNIEVAKRQRFVPFSTEYIKNEIEVFSKDNETVLFFGKYKGEITSAAIIIFWSGIGFYHQAASNYKYAKFPVPYLIQWEAIKEAKSRGCNLYDFWGYVNPKPRRKAFGFLRGEHPWAGPTLFKMGFGGYNREYLATQDYPLSGRYCLTYFFERLRKLKRGF